ncbi:MAG TPA: hypothetical protein VEW05_06840, partial [Candidatus Polarisedimenticolia bacterium]|nr:hypothetical protein [Candidatus Polarisedimenticolia bacterium]
KGHVVGCADCQTVLAHLEATDEIPWPAADQEKVLAQGEAALLASAPCPSQPASPLTPAKKSPRVLLFGGARWPWLAPAGALAAGLLIWMVLHENQSWRPRDLRESENKVAQNRDLPSVSTVAPRPSPPEESSRKPQSPVGGVAGRVASDSTKQSEKLSEAAATTRSPGDKELNARKDRARDASVDLLTAAQPLDLDAKNPRETLRKKDEAQGGNVQAALAQSQNAQTQNQYNYAPQRVPGPSPLNQMENAKKVKGAMAAAPPSPEPPPSAVSSFSDAAALHVNGAISNPRLISAPGSNVMWLAGRSGLIEFSGDGGASWSRQTSGVLAELLGGSAPSDKICWIVGRLGALLLTTDGGAHWASISSPLAEDLGGIRATDAQHATIWNARNTKNFETSDGGRTWKRVPHP